MYVTKLAETAPQKLSTEAQITTATVDPNKRLVEVIQNGWYWEAEVLKPFGLP